MNLMIQLPCTILAMISYACNRCFNGTQLQNSISFIACGVSERVNDYLHFLGLTTSRQTGLKAMGTLGKASEEMIKYRMSKKYNLRPFTTLDNIDIQARVHNPRLEASTKMFHGSYGYLHFVPEHLLDQIDPKEASLESLLTYIKNSQKKPFEIFPMLRSQEDEIHWSLVVKAQLAKALLDYEFKKDSSDYLTCKKMIETTPPPVEPIKGYKPDLVMLKMMSASDSSSAGVSDMLDQCLQQTGENPDSCAEGIQVFEGDMGTCLNFESLTRQRFPAEVAAESLSSVLNMPGLAHTMWNVASKLINHHWGDSRDSNDTGLHRTAGALGMPTDRLPSNQDFNSLLQMIHKSHSATLVFLLRYVDIELIDWSIYKLILLICLYADHSDS